MKINGINDIRYKGNTVDVRVNLKFDVDKASRWELVDPLALVTYKSHGSIDHIELIDKGIKVHGYEFTEEEEREIEEFLDNAHIKDKIKGDLH